MNITDMKAELDKLADAAVGKGLREPDATAFWRSHHVHPSVWVGYTDPNGERKSIDAINRTTFDDAFSELHAKIAALPSPEEAKQQEFMTALGKLIDLGRENGIAVDFINPLSETMKRLSENAITDQRHEA